VCLWARAGRAYTPTSSLVSHLWHQARPSGAPILHQRTCISMVRGRTVDVDPCRPCRPRWASGGGSCEADGFREVHGGLSLAERLQGLLQGLRSAGRLLCCALPGVSVPSAGHKDCALPAPGQAPAVPAAGTACVLLGDCCAALCLVSVCLAQDIGIALCKRLICLAQGIVTAFGPAA
jgi:hypothetical protein